MKAIHSQKNEILFDEPNELVPSDTAHEHLQRVEEWTQKSNSVPPSNRKRSAKEQENQDLEAKSQLIAEAVQLLDSRDKKTRSRTPTATNDTQHDTNNDIDSIGVETKEESQYYPIGSHFRNSQLSARNYVKHFENNMKRKKARREAISNTYPPIRSKKNLLKGLSTMQTLQAPPVMEPVSWRYKASKNVKFAVKSGSNYDLTHKPSDGGSENGEKWDMKQENDRDWWRWKLKQKFLQNDELLHKLASQRQKLESSMLRGENHRINRNSVFSNKKGLPAPPSAHDRLKLPIFPTSRNSSWHVSVEIPSHMTSSMSNRRLANSKTKTTHPLKSRDPIPNFYTPSKQLLTVITNPPSVDDLAADSITNANQKLKVLKEDPYLSKLLSGNEIFRPEIMLDGKQQLTQQEYKSVDAKNTRRKLSLESLTDTDDELTATKFFNPDVKVLYERLSELEMYNGNFNKNKVLGGVNSREPSDGFLNLPLLLETGRFSRYNKLPSMKLGIVNNRDNYGTSKQQTKKSEKGYSRQQSTLSKMKNSNNMTRNKLLSAPIVGGIPLTTELTPTTTNQQAKLEDLPTQEWAKKLMLKVKKQDISTKTDDGGRLDDDAKKRSDEFNDIFNVQQRKYKVPVDQETNLLYHEILMSKWKKDKHNKEKDYDAGGKNKHVNKGKRGRERANMNEELNRPRGLDIWLENIREKAKRDRLISPLPNNGGVLKEVPTIIS